MSQTPYVLDEEQLELLLNITYYLTLCTYKSPMTPSDAARKLDIPANVAHYRTKRLAQAGLLRADDASGKGRYHSVAASFLIPHELAPALSESSLLMLDGMLGKLHRAVMARTEQVYRDLEQTNLPLTFDLSSSIDLSQPQQRRYPGACYITSTSLSSAQYRKVLEAVKTILDDVTLEEDEKTCTLAFIAVDAPFMR